MSSPSDTADPDKLDIDVPFDTGAPSDDRSDPRLKRVALAGRFGGMNQREAANVLRSYGAVPVDVDADGIHWVVIGAEESPLAEVDLLSQAMRDSAAQGKLEILHETELWQRLGLVEVEQSIRRYYTPAMLAHLLGVSVRVIRRWHRRGLISPVRTLHRLPYFDFQEVATARRLAQWITSGASPQAIERRLVELIEILPDIQRPLDQLSILIEGKQVLLRQGEGLVEPGGQLRFDFDSMDSPELERESDDSEPVVLSIHQVPEDPNARQSLPSDELLNGAYNAEDVGEYEVAIDYYHAILARDGPRPEIDFQIGELLYRLGHVFAARERYYCAIEKDPEFVEARSSLGCVLVETGQPELAIAAFRGTLSLHDDYSDVHYHLACVLEDLERNVEALHHWRRFLELAPESAWAAEATERITEIERE